MELCGYSRVVKIDWRAPVRVEGGLRTWGRCRGRHGDHFPGRSGIRRAPGAGAPKQSRCGSEPISTRSTIDLGERVGARGGTGGAACDQAPTENNGAGRRRLATLPRHRAAPVLRAVRSMAGCPSGQWELTVNQPRNATGVRIPHPPRRSLVIAPRHPVRAAVSEATAERIARAIRICLGFGSLPR